VIPRAPDEEAESPTFADQDFPIPRVATPLRLPVVANCNWAFDRETCAAKGFELSNLTPAGFCSQQSMASRHEPIERRPHDVDDEYLLARSSEKITGVRKGELVEMKPAGAGKTRIVPHVPSRPA